MLLSIYILAGLGCLLVESINDFMTYTRYLMYFYLSFCQNRNYNKYIDKIILARPENMNRVSFILITICN